MDPSIVGYEKAADLWLVFYKSFFQIFAFSGQIKEHNGGMATFLVKASWFWRLTILEERG